MGNLLQYTNKSKAIDKKLSMMLSDIRQAYENGEIRTETEYYYRIKTMISGFYDSLSKPTFVFRPATFAPISEEYNAMIQEASNDMKYIINDCQSLTSLISQSFTDAELSRKMMTNQISYLSKKIDNIMENLTLNQTDGVIIFTEQFNNANTVRYHGEDNYCTIHPNDGILTLDYSASTKIAVQQIDIDKNESNGFPGNTHCVDTMNKELHYIGQDGLHNDIGVICDNSLDTWFEFELLDIPDQVRLQCNNYGFEYAEGISWIGNGPLRLKLILHIASSTPCSWISLVPYLSEIKGIKNCIIESCNVITNDNNVYKVAENMTFDDTLVLMFPAKPIQRIELTLIQDSWYNTKVGHTYYSEVNTKSMSIFQEYDSSETYNRVEGPQPSVNVLGVKYDPGTRWINYNSSLEERPSDEYTKDILFSAPKDSIQRKAGQEIIDAYRYMIGIRNIYLENYTFAEYGNFVSQPYVTKQPISAVTLETKEYIPGDNPEILEYFITFDGGINWHKIYPKHRAYEGIYKYTINNDTISNLMTSVPGKEKKSRNLNLLTDATSVQVKITMHRPVTIANPENSSPIVYQYKLIVETGGDNIEY